MILTILGVNRVMSIVFNKTLWKENQSVSNVNGICLIQIFGVNVYVSRLTVVHYVY